MNIIICTERVSRYLKREYVRKFRDRRIGICNNRENIWQN